MSASTQTGLRLALMKQLYDELMELDPEARAARLHELTLEHDQLAADLHELLAEANSELPSSSSLDTDLDESLIGQVVGPFQLVRSIGSGGMADVYLAQRIEGGFEQQVAIKVMRRVGFSFAMQWQFIHERQLLARLDHPNIARLIDGGITRTKRPWLAMEYVEGSALQWYVANTATSVESRLRLWLRLADAVAHAHSRSIVHGDLKPSNVIVNQQGEPKLIDFGVARFLSEQDPVGFRGYTPRYAAPEQLAGAPASTLSDVYGLGTVLLEILTARMPYAEISDASLLSAIAQHQTLPEPLPADSGGTGAPYEVHAILRKALHQSPNDRYPTAQNMVEDIDRFLHLMPVLALPQTLAYRSRKLFARRKLPILAMLVILLISTGGLVMVAWKERESRLAEARTQKFEQAISDVLLLAGPGHYAGRDRLASEILVDSAAKIQSTYADEPELVARSLAQIGNGLINLARPSDALPILRTSYQAAANDPATSPEFMLDLLKLQALAQEPAPEALTNLRSLQAKLETWSKQSKDRAMIMDTRASLAGAFARCADNTTAQELIDAIEHEMQQIDLPSQPAENVWRQIGWGRLRGARFDQAVAALLMARAIIAAKRSDFSEMRTAEADFLLAQAYFEAGSAPEGTRHLRIAEKTMLAEYPDGHPERADILIVGAQLKLLDHDAPGAWRILAMLPKPVTGDVGTQFSWYRARIATLASLGECMQAKKESEAFNALRVPAYPRFELARNRLNTLLASQCL